jgi:hypothetical protein
VAPAGRGRTPRGRRVPLAGLGEYPGGRGAYLPFFLTFLRKQWCQSNFSSIEDIKTRRNRRDFRQNIE